MWMNWEKKAHRGLRTWILVILQQGPKNGAEIMDSMETGSRGWWRPSPGSVYPMLETLSKEGLIKRRKEDGRYEATPQGKEECEWPSRAVSAGPVSVEKILEDMSSNVSYLEDLARSKDSAKVSSNSAQIRELVDRLSKLGVPS